MDPTRLRAIIRSAQAGEASGFQDLLEAYGPRLYGYFYRATGSHHDSEDLLGEMGLRLVRTLKSYDDRGRFEPWLFRIAANIIRDRIRRSKAAPGRVSLSFESEQGQALADDLPGESPAVEDEMLAAESSIRLQEALDKLDDVTRQIILLRHFARMSFKELARMFECPMGTVLARVHRGHRMLRKLLTARE